METFCPVGGERGLTAGEVALVQSVFGSAIDPAPVRIKRRRWFPFQPRDTLMAPCGHIHFHPKSPWYCDDFSLAPLSDQGLFIHEMTHVWQAQVKGWWYLPLFRHPFCRYRYNLRLGWKLELYGIEQQAEIVRHTFLLNRGASVIGAAALADYAGILPFAPK